MHRNLMLAFAVLSLWVFAPAVRAQVRLVGITGNQETNAAVDETLFEINVTNAATTQLFQTTHIPDSDTIGYNPENGLLYHMSGASTYRDGPGQNGYRDNHYMETYDLDAANPANSVMAVFNANPPVTPDNSVALEFGLPAPLPDWILPPMPRTDDETDPAIGDMVGPDEYDSARGMAWSTEHDRFFLATGRGFYTMTTDGDSTFLGQPATEAGDMKAIAFIEVGGQTKLFAGSKEQESSTLTSNIYEIDPATGQEVGTPISIMAPVSADPGAPVESNHRILGLTQHPETGVVYGLIEPIGSDPLFNRQLVTIDFTTGAATLIGELTTPNKDAAFASIAFVGFDDAPAGVTGDYNSNGVVDAADYVLWRNGGPLANEGDTPGTVNQADYNVWRASFGNGAAGLVSAAVPEPSTLMLVALALAAGLLRRRS
jgi:hypothetical protein